MALADADDAHHERCVRWCAAGELGTVTGVMPDDVRRVAHLVRPTHVPAFELLPSWSTGAQLESPHANLAWNQFCADETELENWERAWTSERLTQFRRILTGPSDPTSSSCPTAPGSEYLTTQARAIESNLEMASRPGARRTVRSPAEEVPDRLEYGIWTAEVERGVPGAVHEADLAARNGRGQRRVELPLAVDLLTHQ